SYAAFNLPAGSVGTRQLRNRAVTGRKLAKGAVTAASLNSASIAGHIALWAQVQAGGHVASSSPHATVVPFAISGIERVTWKRAVSERCMALADPANLGPMSATANASALVSHAGRTQVSISMFDGSGALTPEPVDVVVICP
ncbi:MAG: hypothetical protein ACRDNS_29785, partial [Trebonia sp.]